MLTQRAYSFDTASTPYSADCRSVSLTEGYRSNFPLFHKLFLSRVENCDPPSCERQVSRHECVPHHRRGGAPQKSRLSGRLFHKQMKNFVIKSVFKRRCGSS